jgi:uncharacterized protein YceH (UPF0502 family)
MSLTLAQVEEALEQLRYLGAVSEVQGGGRVPKYRHYMKDWLGVDGTELAVMAELMLRGAQTVGELRGRAARMATIGDVAALKPVLQALTEKGLVVALTPEGRGQVVTHTLYKEREMEQLKAQYGAAAKGGPSVDSPVPDEPTPASAPDAEPAVPGRPVPTEVAAQMDAVRQELAQLRDEVARLRRDIDDLWSNIR